MMIAYKSRRLLAAVTGILLTGTALAQQDRPPPLPIEPTGIIETLPAAYPPSWFLVQDAGFFHMSDGKVYVIDTAADTLASQVKGTFNVSMIGNITQSPERGEIYAAETFHTRGSRGDRIDVLTVFDQTTLAPKGEVILPKGKRFMGMPERYALLIMDNGRWLGVANFSPATSVTLIDLDTRKIVGEIPTPGCVLVYPTGTRGFSSLCADGRFLSTELAADGSVAKQTRTDVFFNSDTTPIFEHPAVIGSTAFFPSIAGLVYPVDIGGPVAKVGEPWNLVPEAERAQKWAPAGIGLIDKDDQGRFYIIMHPDAKDGSYQGGGPEVWVYDAAAKKRVQRIKLQSWGLSLAVSRGENPVLMVVNPADMSLEMYNTGSGEFIKTISGFGQETPLMVNGSK
ncbi:MAG: methylamine dehydrogenase [Halioglobus sp.]|nr:methylamine dehydrogenase [Halioglobus sp.]MCB1707502.1 methylamine dehydrogenase [Halioglobus sp.]MCP5122610.1 methylamine dehydrogenase [Pseudomonadales bacterium]MCP5191778.1 methylamine dehydrogenase [Pseudomonadales bacterium]